MRLLCLAADQRHRRTRRARQSAFGGDAATGGHLITNRTRASDRPLFGSGLDEPPTSGVLGSRANLSRAPLDANSTTSGLSPRRFTTR